MVQDELYLKTLNEHFEVDFTQCESSNIFAYAFIPSGIPAKPRLGTVYIAFKNRKVYSYSTVSESTFANLDAAESKGKFVNQNFVNNKTLTVHKYEVQDSEK